MKPARLIIGNYNYSSWSMRAWLALRVTGIDFETIRIPLDTPDFAAQIASYTPAGRVPVLQHEGLRIWDSLAICEYLAERFPEARLWPHQQELRAMARSVCAEMHAGFEALRRSLPFNARARGRSVEYDAQTHADVARICQIFDDCRAAAGHQARHGPWLMGEFSIVDCFYIPVALRFCTYRIGLVGYASRYVASVLTDPAVSAWVELAANESEVLPHEERGARDA